MVDKFYKYYRIYWTIVIVSVYLYLYFTDYKQSEFSKAVVTYTSPRMYGSGKYPRPKRTTVYTFRYNDKFYEGHDTNRSIRDFEEGETVKIYFRKGKPETAAVYTFFSFWLLRGEVIYPLLIALLLFISPLVGRQFIRDMKDVIRDSKNKPKEIGKRKEIKR